MTMTMQSTMTRPMAPFSTSDANAWPTRANQQRRFDSASVDADRDWSPLLVVAVALGGGLLALAGPSLADLVTAATLSGAF